MNIRLLYFAIFALSGFTGLIYESIWTHYLKLFLGHAAYAQTLVLTIFMGGMAIGAWSVGRYGARIKNLLLVYAIAEGVIGLLAIGFHPVYITATDFSYSSVIPALGSTASVKFFQWSLAAALILPQSILLGATFPLMSGGVIRRYPDNPGKTLAILYFTNSLGAAIGVLVSGFYLIEKSGLPGTVYTAGVINLYIAFAVWLLSRGGGASATSDVASDNKTFNPTVLAFLLCAGFTGLASFMYEIGWIRMLSLVLGSATHSFELMLSAFILGLAIGGLWIKNRIDKLKDPIGALGIIQLLMATMALATIPFYDKTFDLMTVIMTSLSKTDAGYQMFHILSHAICLLVMLPATIFAGMTLPLLTHYLLANGHGESSIGKVYAANTLGAIAGVIIASQLVMPALGVKNVILGGVIVDTALGLALLGYSDKWKGKRGLMALAGAMIALVVVAGAGTSFNPMRMASGVFMGGSMREGKVVFHKDGKTASIDLVLTGNKMLAIRTNGKPDASIVQGGVSPDDPTMILLAALPLSIHKNAKNVAVIGMGSGVTTNTLLNAPYIEQVDTIEIEPVIIEAAKNFGVRSRKAYADPRSFIHIEDAKTFFTSKVGKYDLIVSEPSNPWVSGVSGLFTTEFYRLARRSLNDDGLFVQWLHLYSIDHRLIASVLLAISDNFENYSIYFASKSDIIIVASKQKSLATPNENIFATPDLARDLAHIGIDTIVDLEKRRLGDKEFLDPLFQTFPIQANSDFYPVLDLMAPKARFLRTKAPGLLELIMSPTMEILEGRAPPVKTPDLGYNNYFPPARQTDRAVTIIKILLGETLPGRLQPNAIFDSAIITRSQGDCDPIYMSSIWLPNLHATMRAIIPFLGADDMSKVIHSIKSGGCFSSAPDYIRDWVLLYEAVAARNFGETIILATRLLPKNNYISSSVDNTYLVTVSMVSSIATGDSEGALALWDKYRIKLEESLELRLLSAVARTPGLRGHTYEVGQGAR